jgi:hypothetical protein
VKGKCTFSHLHRLSKKNAKYADLRKFTPGYFGKSMSGIVRDVKKEYATKKASSCIYPDFTDFNIIM